jgi:hypothetical protein
MGYIIRAMEGKRMSIDCTHETCKNRFECDRQVSDGLTPTTYGTGPFHPAVRFGKVLHYWPNITQETEAAAYEWAQNAVDNALTTAQQHTDSWNIWLV